MIEKIYLDTNIFIYMIESSDAEYSDLKQLFLSANNNSKIFTTSELTIAECLSGIERNDELKQIYLNLFTSTDILKITPVSKNILIKSASISYIEKMKLPDAIHLATAIETNCSDFLTYDLPFGRKAKKYFS